MSEGGERRVQTVKTIEYNFEAHESEKFETKTNKKRDKQLNRDKACCTFNDVPIADDTN